jgi:hypothetical protein
MEKIQNIALLFGKIIIPKPYLKKNDTMNNTEHLGLPIMIHSMDQG